ncbi:flagellin lysine-N-methylase [Paenibacillus sp. HJGM_3]|uniref:flagellin lysine-N-methylase n=1 Tax=Paenibacillus sp. HJGM_3 TaxID=3379816 RepID=UPI00385C053B
MDQGMQKLLVPEYMQRFSCTGSQCEDTCCSGWVISVDKQTYKKYNNIKHKELSKQFDQHIKRNRKDPIDATYAKINLNQDGFCPFLSEEKLCGVQQKLGEIYLSNVCATYPRVSNSINGIIEKSGTISCPEMAKLVLLNPEGIEFIETQEPEITRNIISTKMKTDHPAIVSIIEHYFWELRIFTIQVLQNRNYSVQDRFIIIGLFYKKLQDMLDTDPSTNPSQMIAMFTNLIEAGDLRQQLSEIPVQYAIQMELLKELADQRFNQFINSKRYMECFAEFLHGLGYTSKATVEEIAETYEYAFKQYYEPLMNQHEYIIENYLVNYVYKTVFPVRRTDSIFDEFVYMVLHYSLIKLHLIGMAAYHKESFNIDHVVKLIQSFGRTIEHNTLYFKDIMNLITENNYKSMAYMSILIKN